MNKKANYKINKRGESLLLGNLAYIILVVIFFAALSGYLWMQQNGAYVWGEFYAKEISKIVDSSSIGDEITLDIRKATQIADRNGMRDFNGIFSFDNGKKEVCVKLSVGKKTCYSYFNDVNVAYNTGFGVLGKEGYSNLLYIKIIKAEAVK